MELFKGQSLLEFTERFKTDLEAMKSSESHKMNDLGFQSLT